MHIPSSSDSFFARLARIIGLLGLAAALAACSAIKLGYNNLDDVAYWWLDSYVDFSDEQAPRVREDLRRLHRWHRKEELPRVIALLERMEQLAAGDISPGEACAFVPLLRERINAVGDRAEPAVVTLAMGLAPEQLVHLEKKYQGKNADFRKDWVQLTPTEWKDKRFKQFLERSEMIYGELDEPQHQALRLQMERSTFDPRRLLAERERRQQDLLQTLRKLAGQQVTIAEARALMRAYYERTQDPPDAQQRALQQSWIDEGCRSFSVLHNSTTAAQRQAAARRLRAWQRDLRELASQQ